MYKTTMSVVKGIGAGMAVGIAAGVVGATVLGNNKKVKRTPTRLCTQLGICWGTCPTCLNNPQK